ncbi:MAG: FAD-binding oxidoreductase [Candidatus Nanoarchaeia archaeon]|nr:FAD-binding oxidoreductase [Candidatus Nanoarchaeia archaeon]
MNKHELSCYNTDASRLFGETEVVFFPKNVTEVQAIIKEIDGAIVIRGAGTGLEGGCIPEKSSIIDLCKMNKIIDFNPLKMQVRVEAGATIKELNEKLRKASLEFPIYSSENEISTIGGMIALNSSGARSMKYGNVKDWIEEIEFVNGKGELIKTTKADLMDICGMEGITGIIVSANLRVAPIIERSASIFQTDNLSEIFLIARKIRSEKEVSMLKILSKNVSKLLGFPEKYYLIVEFDSYRGKIRGEEYEELIRKLNNITRILISEGYYNSEDPKLFFDKLKEFVTFLEINNVPYFGDLGTGIIYAFFKDLEDNKRGMVRTAMKKLKAKFGNYGIGILRKDFLDSFDAKIIQRVKLRYDPKNKINKGKMIDIDFSIGKTEDSDSKRKEEFKKEIQEMIAKEKKSEKEKAKIKDASEKPSDSNKKAEQDLINSIMTNRMNNNGGKR